jgi:preprotein translocase subunit YajC
MALVFQGADAPFSGKSKQLMTLTAAAMLAAPIGLSDFVLETELALSLPLWFFNKKFRNQERRKAEQIKKMYLMENGQQVVLETYDGILQKINILHSDQYNIETEDDGESILFVMENDGRDFQMSTKDCKLVNLDLTDRICKGICIDTKQRGNLYHRIFDR